MKKLVIIPAYNEVKNIDKVIHDLRENAPQFDYIIINDCSTDNTKEYCEQKRYNIINLPVNLGIGGGIQTGYKYALENKYDVVVQFDGDGQHNASYLNQMFEYMIENKVDMVIGSRFLLKKGFQSSFTRRMGIKFLSNLIKINTKTDITDPTSGFRMVNQEVVKEFCKYYPKDYPEPESIVTVLRKGYIINEIPVEMNEREEGESSINLFRSIYYMIKVSLAICIDKLKENDQQKARIKNGFKVENANY